MNPIEHKYDDLLGREHPDPVYHPRMPRLERAAQFAPFAALTGFGAVITDTKRQEEGKWEAAPEEWDDGWYKED